MKEVKKKSLDDTWTALLNEAQKACASSYSPYSQFRVGASAMTAEGGIFTGSNYENASYGATVCAERAALISANTAGYKKIVKIAVTAETDRFYEKPVAPCGICRQVIHEASLLSGVDIEILMSNPAGSKIVIAAISELLPMAFDKR